MTGARAFAATIIFSSLRVNIINTEVAPVSFINYIHSFLELSDTDMVHDNICCILTCLGLVLILWFGFREMCVIT